MSEQAVMTEANDGGGDEKFAVDHRSVSWVGTLWIRYFTVWGIARSQDSSVHLDEAGHLPMTWD